MLGFKLPVVLEMYDNLLSMWKSNMMLRPLTHWFFREAVQLVNRLLAFVRDSLEVKM